MTKNNKIIAYGLTQVDALAAQRSLANTMKCAIENITITTDPTLIYSLSGEGISLVGVKAHATDQNEWSLLMPVCRHMKANGIRFQIIK